MGWAPVYRAVRVDDFRMQVAIKILEQTPGSYGDMDCFHTERQIIATLDHPHIARLLDGGTTEEGLPYLVMEYVEGESIDRLCETSNLTVRDRLRLFQKLCAAVQYAHEKQIIHCDLKPRISS